MHTVVDCCTIHAVHLSMTLPIHIYFHCPNIPTNTQIQIHFTQSQSHLFSPPPPPNYPFTIQFQIAPTSRSATSFHGTPPSPSQSSSTPAPSPPALPCFPSFHYTYNTSPDRSAGSADTSCSSDPASRTHTPSARTSRSAPSRFPACRTDCRTPGSATAESSPTPHSRQISITDSCNSGSLQMSKFPVKLQYGHTTAGITNE